MAAPHVAGFAAYLLALDSSLTPSSVTSTIQSKSLTGILSGIRKFVNPSTSTNIVQDSLFFPIAAGTTNALINNGL